MDPLYDKVTAKCSKLTTRSYSTSFSLGIHFLNKKFHEPIYGIYGFVRFADEIVDTFHNQEKSVLAKEFREETYKSIERKFSLNPILNSFQKAVNKYNIEEELYDTFLKSMEMDLNKTEYSQEGYEEYILGSAEVVGLMCLRVFVEGDEKLYQKLKPQAKKLGSAFQKINFLRDLKADYEGLGRIYFPGVSMEEFNQQTKQSIELDIKKDFDEGLEGIKNLPKGSRLGVYVAYVYYTSLFKKIRATSAEKIMQERIRVPNTKKFGLLLNSYIRHSFNVL